MSQLILSVALRRLSSSAYDTVGSRSTLGVGMGCVGVSDKALSDTPIPRQAGRIGLLKEMTKRRERLTMRKQFAPISISPTSRATLAQVAAPLRQRRAGRRTRRNPREQQAFAPAPIPAWARAGGRAGGCSVLCRRPALALLDAHLRPVRRRRGWGSPGAEEGRRAAKILPAFRQEPACPPR